MHDWVILVVMESVEALKTEFRIRKSFQREVSSRSMEQHGRLLVPVLTALFTSVSWCWNISAASLSVSKLCYSCLDISSPSLSFFRTYKSLINSQFSLKTLEWRKEVECFLDRLTTWTSWSMSWTVLPSQSAPFT